MGAQGALTGRRSQVRWLLLGFLAALASAALACGSGGPITLAETAGEGPQAMPPVSDKPEASGDASMGEEAHGYYDEARRMAVRGRWAEAVARYDQAIAVEPSYWAAYEGRAEANHALGRHDEAITDYSRAMQFRETPQLYVERGHAYLERGAYLRSDQDYHQALSRGPLSARAYIGMGDAHLGMEEYAEAARSYSEAVTLDPDRWRAYYRRGLCYFALRRFQRALTDFERVIALQPHKAGPYFARGVSRWLGRDCAGALEDFQTFVALSADGEDVSRAQEYIQRVRALAPCEPPAEIPALG